MTGLFAQMSGHSVNLAVMEPWNHELSELEEPFKSASSVTLVFSFTVELVWSFLSFKEDILKWKFYCAFFTFIEVHKKIYKNKLPISHKFTNIKVS